MANPNMANATTIYGNTGTLTVTTLAANIVQNPASSGAVYKISSLTVANINVYASSVDLELNVGGTTTYMVKGLPLPANSAINIIGKDTSIYLLENSSLKVSAIANDTVRAVCSWEQIS